MQERIIITGLLFVLLMPAISQDKWNYKEVDVQSYNLFLQKDWTGLIDYSAKAREQGIDFYYLQIRTGIAFYNLGKYRKASHFFLEAYENDQSSEFLQEYVYYSLISGGRILEARKYTSQFDESLKKKLKLKTSRVTYLAYETGYIFNSEFEDLKSRSFTDGLELGDDYGEAYLLKDYSFHSLDLSHQLLPNLSVNHNLTYIDVNREAQVDWGEQFNSPIGIRQFQYFINPVWVIGKKLNVSPSLNLILGNRETYIGGYDQSYNKVFTLSSISYNDYVFSTSIWTDFKNLSPGVEFNTGKIGKREFTQASAWLSYYPLSNTSLYITPKVYFKSGGSSQDFEWNAFGISVGGQLGKVHLSGQYLFGEMESFVESGGYLISNFPGTSDQKLMGSIYYPLGKKFKLVFRYINQDVSENYRVYSGGVLSNAFNYKYTKQTITGGISWIL